MKNTGLCLYIIKSYPSGHTVVAHINQEWKTIFFANFYFTRWRLTYSVRMMKTVVPQRAFFWFVQRSQNLPDIIIFQLVRLPFLCAFLKMAKKIIITVWGELFVELINSVGLDLSCFCHLKTEKCALKVLSKSHTRTHTRTHTHTQIQIFVD